MTPSRLGAVLFAAYLLSACAGMNEQACLTADWQTIGFEDGAAGRPEDAIGGHRQACSRHGVAPDLEHYREGHAQGVAVYCRPSRGFDAGRRGARYQGVCPSALESDFLAAFQSGRHLRELETELRRIDNQISSNERLRRELEVEMTQLTTSVAAEETSAEDRVSLVARAVEVGRHYAALGTEIEVLRDQRELRERELREYRETLAFDL